MTSTTILAIIGVITALLTFVTALIAYRQAKLKNSIEAKAPPLSSLNVLKFRQQLPKEKGYKLFLIIMFLFLLGFLIVSLRMLYVERSLRVVILVGLLALCLWSLVFQLRVLRRGRSPVRREAQFSIDGDYDAIFDRCENALRRIGATIILTDREIGLIHARTGESLRSFGEQVEVAILRSGHSDFIVTVISDCQVPAMVDYGKNSDNLDNFIKYF